MTRDLFNLAYHAHQDMGQVMGWPLSFRLRMLKRLEEQWEYEDKPREKS